MYGMTDDIQDLRNDLKDFSKQNDVLRARIAELEQYKTLYSHALDCVDRVFQVCKEIPNPILPDFATLGESKFQAVIRLAEAYKELERANAELSRDAKRWKTCERLAESQRHNREKLWTIRFVPGKTFADAIDGEGV